MTERIGEEIAEGLAVGMEKTQPSIDALQGWGSRIRSFFDEVSSNVSDRIQDITSSVTSAQAVLQEFSGQIENLDTGVAGLGISVQETINRSVNRSEEGNQSRTVSREGDVRIQVDVDLGYTEKIDYDEVKREIERETKRALRRVQS